MYVGHTSTSLTLHLEGCTGELSALNSGRECCLPTAPGYLVVLVIILSREDMQVLPCIWHDVFLRKDYNIHAVLLFTGQEVNFPRLRGRISDNGERERPACIFEHRSLPTVREQGSPARSCTRTSTEVWPINHCCGVSYTADQAASFLPLHS